MTDSDNGESSGSDTWQWHVTSRDSDPPIIPSAVSLVNFKILQHCVRKHKIHPHTLPLFSPLLYLSSFSPISSRGHLTYISNTFSFLFFAGAHRILGTKGYPKAYKIRRPTYVKIMMAIKGKKNIIIILLVATSHCYFTLLLYLPSLSPLSSLLSLTSLHPFLSPPLLPSIPFPLLTVYAPATSIYQIIMKGHWNAFFTNGCSSAWILKLRPREGG